MIPTVLYQDDDLLVLNKPSGMVVNRAESVKGETVQEWVEKNIKYKISNIKFEDTTEEKDFLNRSGIVHRIDKETSGILLVAKNPSAFRELQRQFREREVKKTYLALVHGHVPSEGNIRAPVGRLPWNREHFGIVPGGKESVTRFQRMSNFKPARRQGRCQMPNGREEMLSLVTIFPETGRTHQIRVHFKYIGYPVVGDYLYAGRKQSRDDRIWAPRVMLHAWKIAFSHPKNHKPLAFEAPIPDDMRSIINPTNPTNKQIRQMSN